MPASPPDSSSSPMAKNAALIATFYYQRDLIEVGQPSDLVNSVIKDFHRKFFPLEEHKNYWQNPYTGTLLRLFRPHHSAGHDTTVLQLVLNAKNKTQSATQAWPELRKRLKNEVNKKHENNEDSLKVKGMVGYTLTYQALLTQNTSLNETRSLTDLLPDSDSRQLLLSSETVLGELAVTDIHNGRVWLLKIPYKRQDHGLKAEMVYVAVSPKAIEHEFNRRVLLGPSAVMLIPDLIAHKSYHQIRAYRRYHEDTKYSQTLNKTRTATMKLLEDASQNAPPTDNFNALRDDKRLLTGSVALLEAYRISLEKQLYNYGAYVKQAKEKEKEGDIVTFHHSQMQGANKELKLQVKEGKTVLEASAAAVNLIQSHLDKAENLRLQQITATVGFWAVVVAAAPLINPDTLAAFWALLKRCATPDDYETVKWAVIQIFLLYIMAKFGAWRLVVKFRSIRGNENA